MNVMTTNEVLEAMYGPAAAHSEYKRGEQVRYHRTPGDVQTGEILFVVAPHPITMRDGRTVDAPLSYIIASDDGGMPDVQYQPDILTPFF
jgi:hypothetical protein